MKRMSKLLLIFIMCLSIILQGVPSIAADDKEKEKEEPTYKTKYTAKKVKKPPYCISVDGTEDKDFADPVWDAGSKTRINIIGQCDDDKIGSEWEFKVNVYILFSGETEPIEGLEGSFKVGIYADLKGEKKANMTDIAEKRKEKEKEEETQRKTYTPRPKPPKYDATQEEMKKMESPTKEVYKTEFDIDLKGNISNWDSTSIYGKLGKGDQQYEAHVNMLPEDTTVESKAKVKLTVYSENDVVAEITVDGKTYGPYAGIFTCQEDLDVQRKDTGTWPIWGIWTDANPYERMPNVTGDYETIKKQIEENQNPKKVNYMEGRWVSLKKGRGDETSTYSTLQVSETDITYEEGEIWLFPGNFLFKPKARTVYSRDMTEELHSYNIPEYTVGITYYTGSDTISYQGFGMLIRVRDPNVIGVWSSIGNLPMPNVESDSDIPAGTWYEFKKVGNEEQAKASRYHTGAYTFTRIISNEDKSIVIDKGTTIMMPVFDNENITLSNIESERIDENGTKTKSTKEDEIIGVSDYNKSEGTIKYNAIEYTLIPGMSIEGSWSTLEPSVKAPDIKSGSFKVRDENGNAFDPPADSQWLDFNKGEKTLTWTKMVSEPAGILVETSKYRTFGEDMLLLTDIKGSFYANPGTDIESFEDEEYMYGEKLLHVELIEREIEGKKGKVPVSFTIEGEGKFLPILEGKEQE